MTQTTDITGADGRRGCDEIDSRLSEFVDGSLDAATHAAVESHVQGCARCAALADDLGRIRRAAPSLGPIDPPAHVWLEIAGQIHQAAPSTPPDAHEAARGTQRWQWIGLAAALVVSTAGAYVYVHVPHTPAAPAKTTATASPDSASASVDALTDDLTQAMTHYEKAIGELETLAKDNNGALDPAVATSLQKNLTTIDDAIAESRTALTRDPSSVPARDSLLDALQQKVSVLQETVALINEIRKGDQAGAAQVVSRIPKVPS